MSPSPEKMEELRFAQQLGCADENIRNKAVKKLKTFLSFKSSNEGFLYEDFIKIWKGLYYCMYMADKPLYQEDLAEEISKLIHCVSTNSQKLLFFKASLDTVAREWNGVDKFRCDKFLMLVTRILRQMLILLSKTSWSKDLLRESCEILESHIICPRDDKNDKPLELKMHFSDIVLEELAKVGKEKVPDRVIIAIIRPFLKVLAMSSDKTYVLNVTNRILHSLIKQSKLGLQNEEDITSKEVMVLPRKAQKKLNVNEMESDEEVEEKDDDDDIVMDPRIGGVDVHLPLLRPSYAKVASAIESVAHNPEASRERRKNLFLHAKKFRLLEEGVYPFNFPEVAIHEKQKDISKKALKRLAEFDEEISTKKRKIIDDNDIEDIENYEPEKRPVARNKKKNMDEMSKKKKNNIIRSNILRNKKDRRLKKINKYQKNPKTLQKFLQKEKEENLKKRRLEARKKKNNAKSKETAEKPVKSNAEDKTCLQQNNSLNIVKNNNKIKKSANKLKVSNNDDKLIENSTETTVKFKGLKSNKAEKSLSKNSNVAAQKKPKSKSSPESFEKNLRKKEDPWKEPLKEGEIEFNVTKKKYSKKVKSGMLMRKTPNVNTSGKTLKINLKKNTEHEFGDYKVVIKQSPGIPFSAKKKPLPSVLKSFDGPNLIKKSKKVNSRINFIRRNSKF